MNLFDLLYDLYKRLPNSIESKLADEITMLLHASRDCLRNQNVDTTKIQFDCRDGYFGEAFGIARAMVTIGCGYFGSSNLDAVQEHKSDHPEHHRRWWMRELEQLVLQQEGFYSDHRCQYCFDKYHKDSTMFLNSTVKTL
jgi:hypothetical protein